jgi:hypothetical protein
MTRFSDLPIGAEFDFVGGPSPSFFHRCVKISARKYEWRQVGADGPQTRFTTQVGTTRVTVYHVGPQPTAADTRSPDYNRGYSDGFSDAGNDSFPGLLILAKWALVFLDTSTAATAGDSVEQRRCADQMRAAIAEAERLAQ